MSKTETPKTDTTIRAIVSVAVAGTVASMVSLLVFDEARALLSTLAGVAIAVGNLWSIAYVIRGFLAPARWRLPFALIASSKMEPLPLALGLGALPFGIIFGFASPPQAQEES